MKITTIITLTFFLIIFPGSPILAQSSCHYIPSAQGQDYYDQALKLKKEGKTNYTNLLKKALLNDTSFIEARFLLAENYYEKSIRSQYDIQMYSRSSYYFSKAMQNFLDIINQCPSFNNYAAYYYYADLCFIQRKFPLAGKYFNEYMRFAKEEEPLGSLAKEKYTLFQKWNQWIKKPVEIRIVPVSQISSSKDEYLPCISNDGEIMYFTRKTTQQAKNSIFSETVEEFTVSYLYGLDSLNNWQYTAGTPMEWPFNQSYNQGAVSLNYDKNKLYMTICKGISIKGRPFENCDIYVSENQSYGWSPPESVGYNINAQDTWEAQPSIAFDGKHLYFASARPENIGGTDLYYSTLDSTGLWGKPINLGPEINTINNEKSPFIHIDNKTLYFSSDGWFGLGGYDVFMTRKQNDTSWITPINLGTPINTEHDEVGLIVDARGTNAFFSSNKRAGEGGWDIYTTELPSEMRPSQLKLINGLVLNQEEEPIPNAILYLQDAKTLEEKEILITSEHGTFSKIMSPKNKENYILKVLREGDIYTGRLIQLDNKKQELTFRIKTYKAEKDTRFVLHDVKFDSNSDILSQSSTVILEDFVEYLKDNPSLKINIVGHTDDIDNNQHNIELSKRRALAVYKYLLQRGIGENRMSHEGKGEDQPLEDNTTQSRRAENRRVEVVITDI